MVAREHGRLDFVKTEFIERFANFQNHAMAQREIAMRTGAAQIEVAIAEACFFTGGDFVFDLEGRRFRGVQQQQIVGDHFDFACGNFRIRLLALHDAPFYGHDEFAAKLLGLGMQRRIRFLVEDNLRDSGAVAQVDEYELAEIAAAMDPAHDHDVSVGVRGAQGAAVMRAFQISQRVKHESAVPSEVSARISNVRSAQLPNISSARHRPGASA